jgi:hypothetical protein
MDQMEGSKSWNQPENPCRWFETPYELLKLRAVTTAPTRKVTESPLLAH